MKILAERIFFVTAQPYAALPCDRFLHAEGVRTHQNYQLRTQNSTEHTERGEGQHYWHARRHCHR